MKLKIPPVVIFALCAILMWVMARNVSVVSFRLPEVALGCVIVGTIVGLAGVMAFRKAQTTVHPHKPENSKTLVVSGVYAISRNPMYLGLAMLLTGWAFWLGEMLTLLGIVGFVVYITYFQILPEEKVLKKKFGKAFEKYCQKTKRWL
ncbi:MAG: isoprenylcysteine carboxylmethyltransferase family protein [Capnocytophaga felis]|nr:isoprenylcysteine carboxylmethyltransferase family protein [Capnocytophaga felis]